MSEPQVKKVRINEGVENCWYKEGQEYDIYETFVSPAWTLAHVTQKDFENGFGRGAYILDEHCEVIPSVEYINSDLTTRKNNKNQMELVDTGFPNALMALGEVMTWASEYKGYKVNDWKDLPNPEMSFIGAASRHRNKRMAGQERDDESNLLHLAHEAFNLLAQLELKITGKM